MSASAPLDGLLVVTIEQAVAAPYCSSRLADAGARVIKIEREGGDFARHYDQFAIGQSSYFGWLNRGKESLTADIKDGEDQALLFIGDRHQGGAANSRLDVLLREAEVVTRPEERAKDLQVGFIDWADGDFADLDTEIARQGVGIRHTVVRGKGSRHRDTEHAVGPEGSGGEVRGDCPIDTPRETDDRAQRKVLLVEVIADSERERCFELCHGLGFCDRIEFQPRLRRGEVDDVEGGLEERKLA